MMFKWIKNHIITTIFICIALIVVLFGIPLLINILYKFDVGCEIFRAEWSAGDALSYYGAILSFIGTVALGALAMYQNHIIRIESDKQAHLLEQRNLIENMPKFKASFRGSNGGYSNFRFCIENITENIATEILVFNIQLCEEEKEPIVFPENFSIAVLKVNNPWEIGLKNKPITNQDAFFTMMMSCKDKYEEKHEYIIKVTFNNGKSNFKLSEITDA